MTVIDKLQMLEAKLTAEADTGRRHLAELLEQRTAAVLAAYPDADSPTLELIRNTIAAVEGRLSEIETTKAEVGVRRADAERAARAQEEEQGWNGVGGLVAQRNDAGVDLEAALDLVADKILAIVDLDDRIRAELPRQPSWWPNCWGAAGIEQAVNVYLAGRAAPGWARYRGMNSVDQLLAGPGIADRIRESGEAVMQGHTATPTPTEPKAA